MYRIYIGLNNKHRLKLIAGVYWGVCGCQ